LILGIAASGVGYIGCFNIVQSSNNSIGPLIWLAIEVALSLLRLAIWAANPIADDPPPPLVISTGDEGNVVTYDIGWTLDDVTVKDLHAVVIKIANPPTTNGTGALPSSAAALDEMGLSNTPITPTTESSFSGIMYQYLTEDLAVPEDQVQLILTSYGARIEDALQSLAKNTTIRRSSPIIIYVSYQSNHTASPKRIGDDQNGLLYSTFFELVRRISDTKGENVVSRMLIVRWHIFQLCVDSHS
jgi:hypothetical protein